MDSYQRTSYTLLQTSLVLALPREIREVIYDNLLVHGAILVECGISRKPEWANGMPENEFPLNRPVNHRKTWFLPLSHVIDVPEQMYACHVEGRLPENVDLTYQLLQKPDSVEIKCINLQGMQVCRQLYLEAREAFYGKNTFCFRGDFRVPTALAFLQDRSTESLRCIRSLELSLTEDLLSPEGSIDQYVPSGGPRETGLVLRFVYNYFDELCSLMSSPRMCLRNLVLTVETFNGYAGGAGEDRLLLRLCVVDEVLPGTDVMLQYGHKTGNLAWQTCALRVAEGGLVEVEGEAYEQRVTERGRLLAEKGSVMICCSEMKYG